MSPYKHLTPKDREEILKGINSNHTLVMIAEKIGCSKSTVSREITRNGGWHDYSAVDAQNRYQAVRKYSGRRRILSDDTIRKSIVHYIVDLHWSPEQISGRLRHENSSVHIRVRLKTT